MTAAQWKRSILTGLDMELRAHLESGAEWLFHDKDGEPLTPKEEARMRAAVDILRAEFRRRGL